MNDAAASALPAAGSDDVLVLVDLSNFVFRAYHAMPPLTNALGEPTNATLGTLNMLNRMIEERQPAFMAVAMDSRGRGFRGEMAPSYKANRPPTPQDLIVQIERCREIFEAYRVPIYRQDDYEADDIIATAVRLARQAGLRVVIASSDKDLMQLVEADGVWLWDAMRSKAYGPPEVRAKLGVGPDKVHELLALVGDSSDNIPGVPGVGPKTATKLLEQFGNLDALRAGVDQVKRPKLRQSLLDNMDGLDLAYRLIELRRDASLDFELDGLRYGEPDTPRLRALFTELQFTRFLDKLERDQQQPAHGQPGQGQPAEPPQQATVEVTTVLTAEGLDQLVSRVNETKTLALTALGPEPEPMRTPLTGLALSPAVGQAYYLPIGHRVLTAVTQIGLELLRSKLGPLLADRSIAKLGHDLKTSRVVLARHGLSVHGAQFDSMLASYLLDPEATHKLGPLALRQTGLPLPEPDQLLPKKRKGPRLTVEDLEIDIVATYGAARCEAVHRLRQQQSEALEAAGLTRLQDTLELPVLEVLVQMELTGVQVSPEPLARLSESMATELEELEQAAFEAAGHALNLASPKQLESVLFDELGLKSSRKTKTGRSTDHDALEAIADAHPLPKLVLEHRAIAKLKGTYVDALPKLIHPETGRIHTHWDQAVTATGRLSSKEPNLQNVPIRTAHGKRIREAFTAPEGTVILSADYSQIELRVLAHLSGDPKLVEAFNTGQDVHVRTAMEVFGVAREEVTPTMRAQSKTVNFGVIYGMGPVALGKRLGISRKQAKSFIDAYFERYGGVRDFMARTLADAQKTMEVRTLLGRRRLLPDLRSSSRVKRAYAERIAQNTPIQGTAADLLKLAMVKLAEPVADGVRMVLTVHDELVFEAPEAQIEQIAADTKEAMQDIHELDVPLVVDVGWGATWAHAH